MRRLLPLAFGEFKVQPADYQLVWVIEDFVGFGLVRSEDREEFHGIQRDVLVH